MFLLEKILKANQKENEEKIENKRWRREYCRVFNIRSTFSSKVFVFFCYLPVPSVKNSGSISIIYLYLLHSSNLKYILLMIIS